MEARTYYTGRSIRRKEKRDFAFYTRHICRILMGLLFIGSAYVKMVDPFGFALKIEEYFVSFGMDFMTPASMFFAYCGILAEFVIGWALLLNIQMRITSWLLLLFMLFFTILTFWLAYALDIIDLINRLAGTRYEIFVVTDCGCFGDFIKLTNHQTFYKNVIFLIFTLIIFKQRKNYHDQHWYYLSQWLPVCLAAIFALFAMTHCLRHEPWHDFRPWKVGNFIAAETYSVAPEMDFVFLYRNNNDGKLMELTVDELSAIAEDSLTSADWEANYTFEKRKEKVIKEGINARLADFTITDPIQNTDIKNIVINNPDYHFLIFLRDLSVLNERKMRNTLQFIAECKEYNMEYTILTGTSPYEADSLKQAIGLEEEDVYFCDMTPMKTAVRNSPGLIMLKNGYVMDKWAYRDIPSLQTITDNMDQYEHMLQKYTRKHPPILPDGIDMSLEEEEEQPLEEDTLQTDIEPEL